MSLRQDRLRRALAWRLDPAQMMRDAGFEPDPHQIALLEHRDDDVLVLWPRQSGKSRTCATRVLHQACFDPGDVVILAGEKQKQAKEVWCKAFDMHRILAETGELPSVEKVDDELRFSNGSRVLALPSTVESIRGYAAKLVLIDEAAFTADGTLAKVMPMLAATGGRIICPSTPNGASGWFYEAWHGDNSWAKLTVSIDELPRLTKKEVARQRDILTPTEFRQEFLLEWLDGTQQFFPTETIEAAMCDDIVPLLERLAA
ncbi:terminase large subunit domain-containing protein [Lysobacter sp. HA35]